MMYGCCTCNLFLGFYMRVLLRVQVVYTYILILSAKSVTFHTCDIPASTTTCASCAFFTHISSYICTYILHTCASSCGYIWKEFPRVQPHAKYIHTIHTYILICAFCAQVVCRIYMPGKESEQYREREREGEGIEQAEEGGETTPMQFYANTTCS